MVAVGLGPNLGWVALDKPSPFQLEGVLPGALFHSLALHTVASPGESPGFVGWSGLNEAETLVPVVTECRI